ncbi:NAD(P)/FAD-dependent oxidoreductase [Rhodopila sp.]|jgi:sulfide:quinone oxidoreductase|uniref:NAD(P)/FAD-dependent oxidoreductase n=1 Tax=Rhodopila sp. TaxID=2480087 RepID=UPI002BE62D00|nr:FAD/NAD(P)-binding oxidoreductase [Rhodopila sp.]HVZ10541.1 FAD/NAD(P)-binding oxidoreductase [Rhodopila sp.]
MAEIVVLGAGLGGILATYEILPGLRKEDKLTLIGEEPRYHFVPSNPWVALGWRERREIEVDASAVMRRKKVTYLTQGAQRVDPDRKQVIMNDGGMVGYDYLVIATGPDLAFDEIAGLGPRGHTQSICHVDHAQQAYTAFEALCRKPGPVVIGAAQGASCFGPAYEFAYILDTELRKRRIRDQVKMTFLTPEPYIGHLGLDGVGDTKSLMESEFRNRHIQWVTNARIDTIDADQMAVQEIGGDGAVVRTHTVPYRYAMILPPFRGIAAVREIEGLVNPRGFVLIDRHQRNPAYPEVFGIGVCVAIPPVGPTPVPVGTPKTRFMIESMVTATARNIGRLVRGEKPNARATLNAICLADFGDGGVAFVAQPQIPPRNVNWSAKGKWVHLAKAVFEKYFLRKIRNGESMPFYEKFLLGQLDIQRIREPAEQVQS